MIFRSYGGSFYLSSAALSSLALTKTIYRPAFAALLLPFSGWFTIFGGCPNSVWCRRGESNPRPRDYETLALPLSYAGKKCSLSSYEDASNPVKSRRATCLVESNSLDVRPDALSGSNHSPNFAPSFSTTVLLRNTFPAPTILVSTRSTSQSPAYNSGVRGLEPFSIRKV